MRAREPAAIKLGFKPNEAASEEVVLMTMKEVSGVPWTPYGLIISSPCESSGLRGTLRCIQKTTEYEKSSLLAMYPEEQELIEKLNIVMTRLVKNVMADLLEAGYYGSHSQVVKEEGLGSLAHPIEFSFDEMFQTDGWALICITSLPFTIHCSLTMSIDYMWDDVEIGTREVTKYREVPVQVEKQRTVTNYEKISVWEWLFR